MTDGFSEDPIEGREAARHRQMYREWSDFKESDYSALKQIAWAANNWKFLALLMIIGAAGTLNGILEKAKEWIP